MKIRPKNLLILALFCLPLALPGAPFDPDQTLEIELRADHQVTIDELAYFEQGIKRVFKDRNYAGEWEFGRWSGASQSEDGPLLEMKLILWGERTPSRFECRIYATAISDGEKFDLGVIVGETDSFVVSKIQLEKRLVDSAADAVNKLYDKLIENGLIATE